MLRFHAHRTCLLLASTATILGAAPAYAQDGVAIEEVVVTARKREESLQSVPVAVSAMTGDQIQRSGVQTLQDLGRTVPSLRSQPASASNSFTSFVLRGQSASDVATAIDQPVGVYLDGVYVARPRGLNAAFFDIDRVEVLKGPQGTLYGRNTTGGAINILTRSADYGGLHGYIGGDLGSYDLKAVRGAVNVPIVSDKLALRLAYQGTFRDGYGKSRITGQDFADRNQQVFRASLRFDPAPNFNVQLKAEHYRSRENGNMMVPVAIIPGTAAAPTLIVREAAVELFGTPGCAPPGAPAAGVVPCFNAANVPAALAFLNNLTRLGLADPYTSDTDIFQRDDNTITTAGLTLTWDLADNLQLKSISGFRKLRNDQVFDLDATRFNGLEVGVGPDGTPINTGKPGSITGNFTYPQQPGSKGSFSSQEFNLSGQAFDGRLNWLGGVFYSTETAEDSGPNRVAPALVRTIGLNEAEKLINDSWSLYSQNDFDFTETLSITLGGRYTEEHKGLVSRSANFNPLNGTFACTSGAVTATGAALVTTDPYLCRARTEANFSGYSYLASLNWKVTPDQLVYLKTAKGFRGGAFQARSPTLPPAGPETAKDIEIGFKGDWFDRRLRTNLAGYRTKYTNKQESVIIPNASGTLVTVIQNAADATLHGFEAEVTAAPVRGLSLSGQLAYIKGKYDRFPGALPVQGGAVVGADGERFSIPPWTYGVSARYAFEVPGGNLALQADWSWQDGARPPARLVNPNIPAAIVDKLVANLNGGSYTNGRHEVSNLNARIDYDVKDMGLTASVFVTNLLDKTYLYGGIDPTSTGAFAAIPSAPRMWGVSLRKTFGNE